MLAGLAIWLVPAAAAKFMVSLSVSSSQPRPGDAVQVVIRTGSNGGEACRMRLVAIAPGAKGTALDALINGGIETEGEVARCSTASDQRSSSVFALPRSARPRRRGVPLFTSRALGSGSSSDRTGAPRLRQSASRGSDRHGSIARLPGGPRGSRLRAVARCCEDRRSKSVASPAWAREPGSSIVGTDCDHSFALSALDELSPRQIQDMNHDLVAFRDVYVTYLNETLGSEAPVPQSKRSEVARRAQSAQVALDRLGHPFVWLPPPITQTGPMTGY